MFEFLKKRPAPMHLVEDGRTIMHVGVDTENRPICLDSADVRQHMMVTGSTGSGKTEFLLGLASHAFAWKSGGVYVDGKGDITLYVKLKAIARHFGREDDLCVLNFMTSSMADGPRTHRFNPFLRGSAQSLVQMVVDLMEDVGPDGALWKGRATALMHSLISALVWRRDHEGLHLTAGRVRDHLALRSLIDLADPQRHPDMPESCRMAIRSYLGALPGYAEDKGYRQSQSTLDQHGYLQMQFTKLLGMFADVYPHIFETDETDIDMEDLFWQRRFLLVMLPALEKSDDQIAALGKVIVAALKSMAATVLESGREFDDVPVGGHHVPDSGSKPFLCILDESCRYAVSGMDLLAAQARSLGIGLVFSNQDMEMTNSASRAVARSMVANTKTKVIMRTDGWGADMTDLFSRCVPGRRDVVDFVSGKGKEANGLFSSPAAMVQGLEAGEFALLNAGRLLIGKGHYIKMPPRYRESDALFEFRSVKNLSASIVRNERARRTARVPKPERDRFGPGEMPEEVRKLCDAVGGGVNAVMMARQALMALTPVPVGEKKPSPARETVMMGE